MSNLYAEEGGTLKVYEEVPNSEVKRIMLDVGTGTKGDTIIIDLGSYGMTELLGIHENLHTTDGSVVVPTTSETYDGEVSTTSVSSNVLTITLGTDGGTANRTRLIEIIGR